MTQNNRSRIFWANYGNLIGVMFAIVLGCVLGMIFRERILVLEPVGDLFLNLLFTVVVPLVFFAISSAIARLEPSMQIGRVIRTTIAVFAGTVLVAGFVTMLACWCWPIHSSFGLPIAAPGEAGTAAGSPGEAITKLLTVGDFYALFSRKSMLALIIFSIGTGVATRHAGKAALPFTQFLEAGNEVMTRLLKLIMYLAPLGLGAYFACQVGKWGGSMFGTYGRAIALINGVTIFYYFVLFSGYALLAGGKRALALYWRNNILPSATALCTSSSIAAIPVNLESTLKMRVPAYIANLVIPLGGPLHKEGSSICEVVKIFLLFSLFHQSLSGPASIGLVLGISLLVSIVEGGIPNGGYIGEILTVSVFGFPPSALPPLILVGTITDPISTLVNATGDAVSAMLITRFTKGRKWVETPNDI
jgi:Na+/H+-dicarboxylate symporter